MPTHNRATLLPRAIESVIKQEYSNIELIIIDDGSTDNTLEVLKNYAAKYSFIKWLHHERPKGACAARNTAIERATGLYITGLDDDDEFLPDHLVKLSNHWDSKYAAIAASLINNNGHNSVKQGREYGAIGLSSIMHYNRIGNQVFTLTTRLKAIGGFDVALPAFQDYDCWVRLSQKYGAIFKTKDHSYVLHTSHEQERISSNISNRLKALKIFEAKHEKLLSKEHKKSIRLIEARIQGKLLSTTDILSSFSFGNWRLIVFAMLSSFRKN
ncbi:MAG: glycosyltransferase involved in cell wall biosynthesis [Psychroserpens sp.]|jgi:glycosyltransferase involved in cell wall biosynthesis